MTSVQMHPQASRAQRVGGTKLPREPQQQQQQRAFSTPFFPSVDALLSAPDTVTRRHTQSPFSSRTAEATDSTTRPRHGLVNLDAHKYPLLSSRHVRWTHGCNAPVRLPHDVRVMTADEYAQLAMDDSRCRLPEHELFPWAHGGADVPFSPASQYFGSEHGTAAQAPR